MRLRFVCALLAAAAAIQTARAQVVEASGKEDTTGMPRVVFLRPSDFRGKILRVEIYCDLTKVAELRNNTYFEIALSPGAHVCSTESLVKKSKFMLLAPMPINEDQLRAKTEALTLEVKPGPKQWVRIHIRNGEVRLATADPAEVKEVERKHIHPVKPEEQTIRSISRTPAGSGK